jgi:hypothetical protein
LGGAFRQQSAVLTFIVSCYYESVEHTVAFAWNGVIPHCNTFDDFHGFCKDSSFKKKEMYGDSLFENYITFSDFMMYVS